MRLPHVQLIVVLSVALVAAAAIGVSGQFTIFDEKGILSGPFSALVLIAALAAALLVLVILDYKFWQPQREQTRREFLRWLNERALGNAAAAEVVENWRELSGTLRGRPVKLTRENAHSLRWSMALSFHESVRIVRLLQPQVPAAGEERYSSGDADFDAKYAWQTQRPETFLPHLKSETVRASLKRLASLIAAHGELSDQRAGVRIAGGEISVIQSPAPLLSPSFSTREEAAMILHDLSVVASALSGESLPQPAGETSAALSAQKAGLDWLVLGCAGIAGIVIWLGGTWALAAVWGLPAAMLVFFTPALILVFLFMAASAASSGRDPEIEDAIRNQSQRIAKEYDLGV